MFEWERMYLNYSCVVVGYTLLNYQMLLQVGCEIGGSNQTLDCIPQMMENFRYWRNGSCLCRGCLGYEWARISELRCLILWWNRTTLSLGHVNTLRREKRTERIVQCWTHFKSSIDAVQWIGRLKISSTVPQFPC